MPGSLRADQRWASCAHSASCSTMTMNCSCHLKASTSWDVDLHNDERRSPSLLTPNNRTHLHERMYLTCFSANLAQLRSASPPSAWVAMSFDGPAMSQLPLPFSMTLL